MHKRAPLVPGAPIRNSTGKQSQALPSTSMRNSSGWKSLDFGADTKSKPRTLLRHCVSFSFVGKSIHNADVSSTWDVPKTSFDLGLRPVCGLCLSDYRLVRRDLYSRAPCYCCSSFSFSDGIRPTPPSFRRSCSLHYAATGLNGHPVYPKVIIAPL